MNKEEITKDILEDEGVNMTVPGLMFLGGAMLSLAIFTLLILTVLTIF